ncbi:glycosyl hydrolase [Nakamurella sp. A5-74]|uniref:Glycosyl hydrolase n=1 Tax=Nakamurella sp. A5-74 TaxID=3158264 RepID=A0AAU8DNL3_9ACTN
MRFGVNYTPSVGWFHSWLDYSEYQVARDLEAIAELGVDHVRIFPLWPVVQPNRTLIRPAALRDVASTVRIAGSVGLDVNVDGLQGHLSSFDFVPTWLTTWHRRGMFTDPDVIGSTADYLRALTAAVADQPHLMGITIGNETNQFAHAPHPSPYPVDAPGGHRWAAAMTAAVREGLGGRDDVLVTLAQYDAAWYDDAQPFGPEHAAEHGDATVTHSWVFNGAARHYGPLGPGSVRHAEYLLQLAAAWNPDPLRPNWLQEVGAPTNVVPVADTPEFLERTVRSAADVQHLLGITWWCSHDVPRSLADFPELEYDLGLLDESNRRKATGDRLAALVADLRGRPDSLPPAVGLIVDDVDAAGTPIPGVRLRCAPGGPVPRAWTAIAERDGRGPQLVLRSRTGAAVLDARGITRLVTVPEVLDPSPAAHAAARDPR